MPRNSSQKHDTFVKYGAWKFFKLQTWREWGERTHSVRREQTGSAGHGTNMPSSLDEVDGVDVVGVDDPRAAQAAHDLGEDVRGDLAPGEVPERRHCDRDKRT